MVLGAGRVQRALPHAPQPAAGLAHLRDRYDIRRGRLRNRAAGRRASRLNEKPISQFQQAVITFERGVVQPHLRSIC